MPRIVRGAAKSWSGTPKSYHLTVNDGSTTDDGDGGDDDEDDDDYDNADDKWLATLRAK